MALNNWNETHRYTIIRGRAYDIAKFMKTHPGGDNMLELGVGRDSTIMFESAHLRDEVAEKSLQSLPQFEVAALVQRGVHFDKVEESFLCPKDSKLYASIKKRVINEVMRPRGKCVGTVGARGVPVWHWMTVLCSWAAAATWFCYNPTLLNASILGLCMSWVGTGVQHTANHGGLIKNNPLLNFLLGLTNDICVGGSSLVWRYHHQVSHHAYCNDVYSDQDVHSSFPFMRLDKSQPVQWHHAFQRFYCFPAFSLLWVSIQMSDFENLVETCCYKVNFNGTSGRDIVLAFALKLVHYGWILGIPCYFHGLWALLLSSWVLLFGSFWTSLFFVVSHNLEACKDGFELSEAARKDWAIYQIETSASWGGEIMNFFTGGLNLQIEHHLFPCIPHNLHPPVQKIVMEECAKAGIRYNYFSTLLDIIPKLYNFLQVMGEGDGHTIAVAANEAKNTFAASAQNVFQGAKKVTASVASGVANSASEVVKSAENARVKMVKIDDKPLYNQMLKPVFLVFVYQGLQELYTAQWDKHISIWSETSPLKPAIFTVIYLLMIYGGKKYMQNREPDMRLRKYMLTYNLYQIVLNSYCVYAFLQEVFLHPHPFSMHVDQSSYKLTFLIWVHYNNKFIELLDTVFMVFNKKNEQVSFLHVWHHVLLMWSWFAVIKWGCGGIAWFSAAANSFVHVAMYGYYFLAALKIECIWKKQLTMIQLTQFVFCMASALYAIWNSLYPFYLSCLNIFVMGNMLVLFTQFYTAKYKATMAEVAIKETALKGVVKVE